MTVMCSSCGLCDSVFVGIRVCCCACVSIIYLFWPGGRNNRNLHSNNAALSFFVHDTQVFTVRLTLISVHHLPATMFVLCAGYSGVYCETDIDKCASYLCYYVCSQCRIYGCSL